MQDGGFLKEEKASLEWLTFLDEIFSSLVLVLVAHA